MLLAALVLIPFLGSLLAAVMPAEARNRESWLAIAVAAGGLLMAGSLYPDVAAGQVLREELADLLDAGVSIVQLDEPVLSEVVFSGPKNKRSFMCGALSETEGPEHELAFARELVNAVVEGLPRERMALHVCRGNWTPDESVALAGSYAPLIPTLAGMRVGAYLLEACTPRAGDMALLQQLPADARIGVGVVNQKQQTVEAVDDIAARIEHAIYSRSHRQFAHDAPDDLGPAFEVGPVRSFPLAPDHIGGLLFVESVGSVRANHDFACRRRRSAPP